MPFEGVYDEPAPANAHDAALGACGDGCAGARISSFALDISGAVAPFPFPSQAWAGVVVRSGTAAHGAEARSRRPPGAWLSTHILKNDAGTPPQPSARREPAPCAERVRGQRPRRSACPPRARQARLVRRDCRRAHCHACHRRAIARACSRALSRSAILSSCACTARRSPTTYAAFSPRAACMLTMRAASGLGEHGGGHPQRGLDERSRTRPSSARWTARVAPRPAVRHERRLPLPRGRRCAGRQVSPSFVIPSFVIPRTRTHVKGTLRPVTKGASPCSCILVIRSMDVLGHHLPDGRAAPRLAVRKGLLSARSGVINIHWQIGLCAWFAASRSACSLGRGWRHEPDDGYGSRRLPLSRSSRLEAQA
jgi:hypothetical protein